MGRITFKLRMIGGGRDEAVMDVFCGKSIMLPPKTEFLQIDNCHVKSPTSGGGVQIHKDAFSIQHNIFVVPGAGDYVEIEGR